MHGNREQTISWLSPTLRALLIAILLGLAACAGTPEAGDPVDMGLDAEELYAQAWGRIQSGNFDGAMQSLRRLEARFPFTPQGQQAQLDQIFVVYKMRDRQGTAEQARRYIRENPRSEHLDYAYYMQGMAWYDQRSSFTRRVFGLDPARLNRGNLERSFDAFRELVERYPDSPYSDDARLRMIHLRNTIARHHWYVAEYYLEEGAYMAAAARATRIIEDLQPNEVTPYALDILVEAYAAVGEDSLAADTLRVRDRSYPQHEAGGRPPQR